MVFSGVKKVFRASAFDLNGDGSLDYRPGEPVRNNVNQWILYRW